MYPPKTTLLLFHLKIQNISHLFYNIIIEEAETI